MTWEETWAQIVEDICCFSKFSLWIWQYEYKLLPKFLWFETSSCGHFCSLWIWNSFCHSSCVWMCNKCRYIMMNKCHVMASRDGVYLSCNVFGCFCPREFLFCQLVNLNNITMCHPFCLHHMVPFPLNNMNVPFFSLHPFSNISSILWCSLFKRENCRFKLHFVNGSLWSKC